MEETQQQPLRSSFPPSGAGKWMFNSSDGSAGGSSFGQDSGYTSYHSTPPNNTFNLSSRHGATGSLTTIDEANEADCSMNDSCSSSMGGPVCSNILTPKTAASIDQISNFHLTTPNSSVRPKRPIRRRFDFDSSDGSFVAPSTPERLPLFRMVSSDSSDTPLRTVSRTNQQSQLTPHKSKSNNSIKRKLSSLRGKLYSDGDEMADEASNENRANDLNDSLDCRRLDISPIPKVKRHKPNENITSLIRSSTPKTASCQSRFTLEAAENIGTLGPGDRNDPPRKGNFRKFASFSPSKMSRNRQNGLLRHRQEGRGFLGENLPVGRSIGSPEGRDSLADLEITPNKKTDGQLIGHVTPSKEQRVLAEIHPVTSASVTYQTPMNLAGLISAPILEDPAQPLLSADEQLEQTIANVSTLEDFSMTPSKASLIDPEYVSSGDASLFAGEDFVTRHASRFAYEPTLNSIIEEMSPVRVGICAKLMPPKTPPSSCKSSDRKPKRLATRSVSSGSLKSPLPKGLRLPASPKALRKSSARLQTRDYPGMYCGREQLNVLKRLYERNQYSLHILLDFLNDEDLVQVVQVSSGWKAIIQSLPKQWKRLKKYLTLQKGDKENMLRKSSLPVLPELRKIELSLGCSFDAVGAAAKIDPAVASVGSQADDSSVLKRIPFRICNSQDSSIANCSSASSTMYTSFGPDCGNSSMPERRKRLCATVHSPPVSPSKINFVTNQKIASHLKKWEQLRPCPRCNGPSRIVLSRSSKNGQNKARAGAVGARLEKSYTLPDPETMNDYNGIKHNAVNPEPVARSNSDAGLNNNNYSAPENNQQSHTNGSPNRVRKNLFSSSATSRTSESVISALSVKSSSESRRNSEPHLPNMTGNIDRMRLRSATKSVDYVTYPSATMNNADSPHVRNSHCDYAVCIKKNCGFQFCIKCLCDYQLDTVCFDLAPNSPSKEEERGRPNVACSVKSRKSLLRLCRKI